VPCGPAGRHGRNLAEMLLKTGCEAQYANNGFAAAGPTAAVRKAVCTVRSTIAFGVRMADCESPM
jgi:hypothetical protein